MKRSYLSLAVLLLAGSAQAQEQEVPAPPEASAPSFAVALKLGGALPSFASTLGTAPSAELEVGFLLLGGRLEVDALLGYARPPATFAGTDPRVGGGFSWSLTQEMLSVGLIGRYRFLTPGSAFNAYAAAGPRYDMLRTTVVGSGGEGAAFGENQQTGGELGLAVAAGGELRLGPGYGVAEVQLDAGPLRGLVTGEVGTTALGLLLGYRVLF